MFKDKDYIYEAFLKYQEEILYDIEDVNSELPAQYYEGDGAYPAYAYQVNDTTFKYSFFPKDEVNTVYIDTDWDGNACIKEYSQSVIDDYGHISSLTSTPYVVFDEEEAEDYVNNR